MTIRRYITIFIVFALLGCFIFAGFNALVDPFGVFGDAVFDRYDYNMTQNPRVAKTAYLDRHFEEYDSYIIGCSKTSSFPTELLNEYYNARFYNYLMYGGDLFDALKTAEYILENYTVSNLIVNMGLEELCSYGVVDDVMKNGLHAKVSGESLTEFYARYLFMNPTYALDKLRVLLSEDGYLPDANRVFDPLTGAYNKLLRDTERIGDMHEYLERYPEFTYGFERTTELAEVSNCLAAIAEIQRLCEERGVSFTLIISPLYHSELDMYSGEELYDFFRRLSEVTPFWDFSGYNTVSYDARYFYDVTHFRNAAGVMALGRMFDDGSVYIPDDFGVYITPENVEQRIETYHAPPISERGNDIRLPVLLYHHLTQEPGEGVTISAERFAEHMRVISSAGYTAVTVSDLIAYVDLGAPLPDKPILISFDDGYLSNLSLAAPILREYNLRGTIFTIGVTQGAKSYKDTGVEIIPHFDWSEAAQNSDVFEYMSHSYDMHRSSELDAGDYRDGVLQNPGESESDYIDAFRSDFQMSRADIEENTGEPVRAFAYPKGLYSKLSEALLSELGVHVTFSIEPGVNTPVKGLPQSLRLMRRLAPDEDTDTEELLVLLAGQ